MALGFVDLVKAFDTVLREMVMATLRWMGVPEAEVRMVEGTYEKTTARVVVGEGASDEFEVMNGLRQGSVLSPLLFIAVHCTGPHQQEDGGEGCHEETSLCRRPGPGDEWQTGATGDTGGVERFVYQTWAETEPREDGSAAHRPPEGRAGHRAGGKDTESTGHFRVPIGGAVCGDGKTEREIRRRVQAGANAWRAVEGVMADRRISKRLPGKVMSTCVTPACLYGTETLALTELQQHRLQVCENNWVRKIARVTGADRRRMVELREETGVQWSLTERLARSRLQWAGHIERMADERLPKRAT